LRELAGAARHPAVVWTLVLAGLSLAGAWPLAGALGKEQVFDALLHRAASEPQKGYVLGQSMHLASAGWGIGAVLFLLALPITAAYIARLVGMLCFAKPFSSASTAAAPEAPEQAAAPHQRWKLALWLTLALAAIGSVGWAAAYMLFQANMSGESTAWKWGNTLSAAGMLELLLSQVLVWAGILVAWRVCVRQPTHVERAGRSPFGPMARFFREGMYLREAFTLGVGRTGAFLAMLAGRTETNVIDWLALRCGVTGWLLAALARWVDDNLVDGVRRVVCGLCWQLKRLHARSMQTGQIQHYIFIILLATVLLCFAALWPLSKRLADILGSK
jgi:NADH:ubiquinone oxidoreductase subunit 5 (subunit L)/multisubunit Na+/H+ antiporter MnhA subunit